MSNQEILEKAIQKAIDAGWQGFKTIDSIYYYPDSADLLTWRWEENRRIFSDGVYESYESINVEAIIFSHDFAKALWGECINTGYEGISLHEFDGFESEDPFGMHWLALPVYKIHLMQMVIADDPIKYVGDHLNN